MYLVFQIKNLSSWYYHEIFYQQKFKIPYKNFILFYIILSCPIQCQIAPGFFIFEF